MQHFPPGSPFGGLNGMRGYPDIGAIMNAISGQPIATGAENVMAELKRLHALQGQPCPDEVLDHIRQELGDSDSVKLYLTEDGTPIISGIDFSRGIGDGLSDFSGFDMSHVLRNRGHGGEKAGVKSSLADFLAATKKHLAPAPRAKDNSESQSASIMLASSVTASALVRYIRTQEESAAVETSKGLANMIDGFQTSDQARFENLSAYIEPYALNLAALSHLLKSFVKEPRAKVAETLVQDLARLSPVLVNVMRDAREKAERLHKEALAI